MSKGTRDRSARDRLADERRLQDQRDRQKRRLGVAAGAVVLIVAAVVITILVNNSRGKSEKYAGAIAPATRQADGSIVMANAGVTAPVLEIFEDFQCPACRNLEKTSGNTVKRLAAEGKVKVVYRPFRLFTQEPTRGNSERAANAALCAPADRWVRYHDLIFSHQPAETSPGFANDDLVGWGGEAGITGSAFESCVTKGEKNAQVQQMTDYATNVGKVSQSPTVKLDGKEITAKAFVPGELEKAISAAK
ncbi:MAG: thioredoxin domain-containing protein [Streptosporangiaceae bacterium]